MRSRRVATAVELNRRWIVFDVTIVDCLRYPMLESNAKRPEFVVFAWTGACFGNQDKHDVYYFLIATFPTS
jgi:hypothetical protein